MLAHFIQFPPGGYGTCIEEEDEEKEEEKEKRGNGARQDFRNLNFEQVSCSTLWIVVSPSWCNCVVTGTIVADLLVLWGKERCLGVL
jgi:hypothetical protein